MIEGGKRRNDKKKGKKLIMEKHGVEHVPRMENDREIHIG
jgi:hypothetical protein